MNAFREFEQATERLKSAEKAHEEAQERINRFFEQSTETMTAVLREFSEKELLPGIRIPSYSFDELERQHSAGIVRLNTMGKNAMGNKASDDVVGSRIAEDIVQAAQEQKIPVTHVTNGSQAVQVSDHVKEREKGPEILLRALAAYAEKKGKPELAKTARAAAEKMKNLVSSFREIE